VHSGQDDDMLRRIRSDKLAPRADAPHPSPAKDTRPVQPAQPAQSAVQPAAPRRDVDVKSPGSRLGEILVEEKIITASQLEQGLAKRQAEGGFLGQALIELGHLDQDTLTLVLVKQCKIPHLNLLEYSISPDMRGLIPLELCRRYNVLPVDKMGKILTVAMVDPLNPGALEALRAAFPELRIKPILCDWPDFEAVFQQFVPVKSKAPHAESSVAAPMQPPVSAAPAVPPPDSEPNPAPAPMPRADDTAHTLVSPPVPTNSPVEVEEIRTAIRDGMRESMADLERRVSEASELLRTARDAELAAVQQAQQRDLGITAAPAGEPPPAQSTSLVEIAPGHSGNHQTFDTFVVGANNAHIVEMAKAVAGHPGSDQNPFFVCGAVGLGKTHLITAIGNALKAAHGEWRIGLTSAGRFVDDVASARASRTQEALRRAYEQWDAIILDDVQFLGGRVEAQEDLFHIFNAMQGRGKQIVLAGDRTPEKLGLLEKRLVSRFDSGVVAVVGAPDWETRIRILRHYAKQLNVQTPDDVAAMIAMRHPDDIRRLIGSLRKVAARARTSGGNVTAEIASQVLAEGSAEVAA
jgi:chromosomal replication initiator protein DnaA